MTAGIDTHRPDGRWEAVVGRRFVEALNDGLARSGYSPSRTAPPRPRELPDAFAAAVMRSYEAALSTALCAEDREDRALRSKLLTRGREILVQALRLARLPAGQGVRPSPGELSPAHELVARTLLMECAAVLAVEGSGAEASGCRPNDLIRALGQSTRRAHRTKAPGFPDL
ncbi:hypothetical protein [Streptomyces sp. NPDC048142]|uniref:hypothetical protein n=1 Tax=Streptomyces sp. NPDC048142 TaxID=3365501 RepID=UPI00371BE6D2